MISTLYEYRYDLAAAFRLFDADDSGKVRAWLMRRVAGVTAPRQVNREEFKAGLEMLKLPLEVNLTDLQVRGAGFSRAGGVSPP